MNSSSLAIHHIAAVVTDFGPPRRLFEALGLRVGGVCKGPTGCEKVDVECGPVELCLVRPISEGNPIARWLRRHGPGLHHFMFDMNDLPGAVQRLKDRGVRFAVELQDHPWQRQAFIDPKQSCGGLIELGEWWGRTGPVRPKPGEPVLDHLSWVVRDIEAARSFFKMLGLEVTDAHPDTPIFACDHVSVKTSPCGMSIKAPRGNGPFAKYLAKRGPGIHHICLSVGSLRTAAKEIRQAGFRLTPEDHIPESHQLTWFVHPKDVGGILIELGEPVRSDASPAMAGSAANTRGQ